MTEAPAAPTEVPATTPRWGIPDALYGWAIGRVLVGEMFAALVLAATGHLDDDFDQIPLEIVALAQVGLAFGFFIVPYVITRVKGNGIVVDLGFRVRRSDLWRGGVVGAVLQFPVLVIVYAPILWILDKDIGDLDGPARSLGDRVDGPVGVVLLVLITAVLAPIFEELFYRGLVQRSLLKHGFPPWLAIALTSLFFGITHFQLLQLPGLVLAGAVFGVLAHRAGRLGPAIVAHMAFNVVATIGVLTT